MEQKAPRTSLTNRDGNPKVFNVNHDDDGRWLNTNNGKPDNQWNPDNSFAFVARNPLHFSPPCCGEFCFES